MSTPPTGRAVDPAGEAGHTRLIAGVASLAAIGALVIWLSDRLQGLATAWDLAAIPVLAALYLSIGVLHILRPRHVALALPAALIATGVYLQGALYLALDGQSLHRLYAVASLCQVMPVFYVMAFVAWPRGGPTLGWISYGGIALQWAWSTLEPAPPAGWSELHLVTHKTFLASLLIQPGCLLALHVIAHLRRQLVASQQAAFKDKERFLAMLSHEIRTPLQAMLGSIDLLALKLRGSAETRALDRLRASATQLDTHLRDVTEFTRLENPALRIRTETFDLARLLHDIREEWLPTAQGKGLHLRLEVAPQDEATLQSVNADPQRVRQIIVNLLGNALKYTLVGGVTLHASLSRQRQGYVSLCIEDSGVGIAAEHLDRIFQPHVRLEDTRALRVEGAGLGLAVVKRLVDRLGGSLHVDSHPDRGSRFTVELPIADNG